VTQDHTVEYRIQWGDTLAHIAQRFTGNPYDYERIAEENKIKDPDFILAGDEIKIIIAK
jgi:nucleoid-associated protein YgaU